MRLNKSQIQFIINCDVEEMVHELHTEYHLPLLEAFDAVYNSNLYRKLTDTRTGLYTQSPLYQLSYLTEELHLTDAGKSPANAKSTKESGKTGLQLAEEDAEQGRVTCWPSDDEMFHTILRK